MLPTEYYPQLQQEWSVKLDIIKAKLFRIAIYRLIVFVSGAILTYLLVKTFSIYFLFAALPFLAWFVSLIKKNEKLRFDKKYTLNCIEICKQEINSLKGDYSAFGDGKEFADPQHPYSSDLDIFGRNSMFQYLNRTVSFGGKIYLYECLKAGAAKDEIIGRQKAVQELMSMTELRTDFRAMGMIGEIDESKYREILKWVNEEPEFYGNRFLHAIIWVLPLLTVISLLLGMFFSSWGIFTILFISGLLFTGLYLKKINKLHSLVSRKFELMTQLEGLLSRIEKSDFRSGKLSELKKITGNAGHSSSGQVERLSTLIRLFDNRLNMLAAILLNGLFLWDIRLSVKLEKWRADNSENLHRWLDALSEFDALCSLATFGFNRPELIFPEVSDVLHQYRFESIGHPLIPAEECVKNTLEIYGSGSTLIITGSNMAGKSTFLRATGLNLVLAMAGAPVCAGEFVFFPVQLYTSMRIGDDLSNRESTFYAELKRLKGILQEVEKLPVFILLDEILKGTNSTDKLTGSVALLRELSKSGSVAVIATHDLALAGLEKEIPNKVKNYNFEVEIRDNEFYFDYKLKSGVCKVLNATELMRKMGLKIE